MFPVRSEGGAMIALPARFELARSLWPRTGGDRRNSARFDAPGPRFGRVRAEVVLPHSKGPKKIAPAGGVCVSADGMLIVAHDRHVSWLTRDGVVVHAAEVPKAGAAPRMAREGALTEGDEEFTGGRRGRVGAPVALADGGCVLSSSPEVLVYDRAGVLVAGACVGVLLDDSVWAMNVTHTGALVVTRITGEVELVANGVRRRIGGFGYDILPPAVRDDDALVIAGYAGSGLVCVGRDGARRWRTELRYADGLPAMDRDGFVAVGSLNDKCSEIVAPDGRVVGALNAAAVFSEGPGGDWFARTRDALMRVRRDGSVVWQRPVGEMVRPSVVTDAAGRVYTTTPKGLLAVHQDEGRPLFHANISGLACAALAPAGEGLMAVVCERGRLVLVE